MRHVAAACLLVLASALSAFPQTQVQAREIHLTTLAWEPYYGPDLRNDGFCGAIVKAAFEHQGHEVKISYLPWARALKDAASGRYDGILGGYYTKEREQDFLYTKAFARSQGALIARPEVEINNYDSLHELSPYRIAVGNQFAHTDAFDNADYLNKLPVNRVRQIVRMLFEGRVDIAAISVAVFRYEARELGYDDADRMTRLRPLLFDNGLHIMLPKTLKQSTGLVEDFNKGLAAIKANGTYRDIMDSYGQ